MAIPSPLSAVCIPGGIIFLFNHPLQEMYLSLYALLLRTLVIDLQAKNQHNICKGREKKVWKTIPSMKFTKSKASISAKNQLGAMKLQLDVKVMMIDLHAKSQLSICKPLGKNCRKLFDR